MIKQRLLTHALFISMLYLPLNSFAQTTCDTCSQLSSLNATAQQTSSNTSDTSNLLQQLLEVTTRALFGSLYDFGNTMSAYTAISAVQNNGYTDQQDLLRSVETTYQGSSDDSATLTNNYSAIFNDYLISDKGSFDAHNASISTLYLNPSEAGFYSDDQRLAAQRYIMLASGAAASTARKPSSDWLKIGSKDPDTDKKNIRKNVSSYYTFSAMESALADNYTYIYGLNTGQILDGTLDNYSGTMISESGLITYILSQKAESEDWYTQLKNMGAADLLREQTILLGGGFLMLTRIEEDLRRILVTDSVSASLSLLTAQAISGSMNTPVKAPKLNIK